MFREGCNGRDGVPCEACALALAEARCAACGVIFQSGAPGSGGITINGEPRRPFCSLDCGDELHDQWEKSLNAHDS